MKQTVRDISSVGRAIPCQGIGHRFEPDMSLQITSSVKFLFLENAIPCQGIGHRFEPLFVIKKSHSKSLPLLKIQLITITTLDSVAFSENAIPC